MLANFPDSGRVIASDICRTYMFNSYFTADLSRSDSLLYIKQSYNVGIWLLEFAARVLITIAVELVVALIFGYSWQIIAKSLINLLYKSRRSTSLLRCC